MDKYNKNEELDNTDKKLHISDVSVSLPKHKLKIPREFCKCKNPLFHDIQCPVGNEH